MSIESEIVGAAETVASAVSSFWKKLMSSAAPVLTIAEQDVLAIFKPLLGQFEADALQVAITFIQGVVAAQPTSKSIQDWETAIIQLAEVAGGSLWTTIKGLAGNALQTLIGLVLTSLQAAAQAKAATAPAE